METGIDCHDFLISYKLGDAGKLIEKEKT